MAEVKIDADRIVIIRLQNRAKSIGFSVSMPFIS
jgi:hypothetical protein